MSDPTSPSRVAATALLPGRRGGLPSLQRHQFSSIGAFAVVTVVATLLLVHGPVGYNLEGEWLIFAIADLGFYLVFCIGGRFAFCQTLMMALGAYMAALVGRSNPTWLAIVAGLGLVAAFALVFGFLLRKTGQFLFAVGTLAAAQLSSTIFTQWHAFTGPNGLSSTVPIPSFFGISLVTTREEVWLFLGFAVAALIICAFFERSPVVRELIAAREMPEVAGALGIRVEGIQVAIFVVGSVFGGVAGALFAFQQGSVSTGSFSLTLAIGLLLMPIVGGMDTVWGPVLGALIYVLLPQVLSGLSRFAPLTYGVALLVIVLVFPSGLLGIVRWAVRRSTGRGGPDSPFFSGWRALRDRIVPSGGPVGAPR